MRIAGKRKHLQSLIISLRSAGRIENLNGPLMAPRPQFFARSLNIELACWTGDHVCHVVSSSEPFKQVYTSGQKMITNKDKVICTEIWLESLNERGAFNPCSLSQGSLKQAAVILAVIISGVEPAHGFHSHRPENMWAPSQTRTALGKWWVEQKPDQTVSSGLTFRLVRAGWISVIIPHHHHPHWFTCGSAQEKPAALQRTNRAADQGWGGWWKTATLALPERWERGRGVLVFTQRSHSF